MFVSRMSGTARLRGIRLASAAVVSVAMLVVAACSSASTSEEPPSEAPTAADAAPNIDPESQDTGDADEPVDSNETEEPGDLSSEPQEVTKVVIGLNSNSANQIAPVLALREGIFEKYGIDAEVEVLSGAALTAAMVGGDVQFGAYSAPQPEIAIANGADFKWLAWWTRLSPVVMVARDGITDMQGLEGKVIGITTPGSLTDILARLALQRSGMTVDDVTLQPLQSVGAATSAMIAGSIQATLNSPPSSAQMLAKVDGSSIVFNYGAEIEWPSGGVIADMNWVQENPDATTRVIAALGEAVKMQRDDKAATMEAIKSITPGVEDAVIEETYEAALSVLADDTIVPSLDVESFVLSTVTGVLPGEYPNLDGSDAASYIETKYADEAMAMIGSIK